MQVSEDFVLPPLESEKPTYTEERASEEAFYAAASIGENPIDDYESIRSDLVTQGYSASLEGAQKKWVAEQDEYGKEFFTKLLEDPSIPVQEKRNALTLYSTSGYISKNLKDKYVETIASKAPGSRLADQKAQDEVLKVLDLKRKQSHLNALDEDTAKALGPTGVKQYAEGTWSAFKDVAKSIPASLWGAVQGILDRDLITGSEVTAELMQNWSDDPTDPRSLEVKKKIFDSLSILGVPYEKAQSYILENTGNEQAAIAGGLVFEAITGGVAAKAFKLGLTKGHAKIKAGSVLEETINANPKIGGDLAAAAVTDASGQVSRAVGVDAGSIISDLVLPKPFGRELEAHYPSIHKRLATDIAELDKKLISSLEEFRWDPAIHNVAQRRADYDLVLQTRKDVQGGEYMPSLSSLSPTNTAKYEGKMVFGRTTDLFYDDVEDVVSSYNAITSTISKLPSELKSEVVIVDRLTREKYTPAQLMESSEWSPKTFGETVDTLDKVKVSMGLTKQEMKDPLVNQYINAVDQTLRVLKVEDAESGKITKKSAYNSREQSSINTAVSLGKALDVKYGKPLSTTIRGLVKGAYTRKEPPAKQFSIEWSWAKEYDDLSMRVFGENSVKTKLFGIDASGIARSPLSQWLFGGNGIFPRWFEQSGGRAAPRAARQEAEVLKTIQKKIASTPLNKELEAVVTRAEKEAVESYSIKELSEMFPNLSTKSVEDLYEVHTYWRRVNHFNHALLNLQHRNELIADGFTKGLYINGKYAGPVNDSFEFDNTRLAPQTVWDYEKEIPFVFTRDFNKPEGMYDVSGKQLVALKNPYNDADGRVYTYALVNDTKSLVDSLPDQVVPRTPGYSPIKYKASWYIDVTPTKKIVDGRTITDPEILRKYRTSVAAGTTEIEAKKLETEFSYKYQGLSAEERAVKVDSGDITDDDMGFTSQYDVVVTRRLERNITFNRIMADNEAHAELLRSSMYRGERLPSVDGTPTPIEDRLLTLVSSVQTLARKNSLQAYDMATEKAFMRDFSQFLPDKKFPSVVTDIVPLPSMNKAEVELFNSAVTVFNQYAKVKSFGTLGDRAWSGLMNGIANVFEKTSFTSKLAPFTREVGNKGNLVVEVPRKVGSTLFITLNPLRQWLVQPAQLLELWAINPQTALKRFAELSSIRIALASKGDTLSKTGIDWYGVAQKSSLMDKVEFDKTVTAIEKSGLLESVDLNMLVHGMFNDADRALVEGSFENIYNNVTAVPKAATRLSRQVGFDFAELNNRIGLWMVMKDKWVKNNPNGDWTSPEAIDEISHNEWKWAGSMTRAGSYPYQSGALAVLMQFAAITQKMTMNLIQDNGLLTTGEKARLMAARAALWGGKYGVPGGALYYYYIDQSEDEEVLKYGDTLKRGLADRALNSLFNALSGSDEADLLVSKGMAPYNESTTGVPYVDLAMEVAKIWDDRPAGPRFPAIEAMTSLGKAVDKMQSWFITKDITDANIAKQVFMEAVSVASGMNNFAKAQLMLSSKEKLTKSGNRLGLDYSHAEAAAQLFGVSTWREEALWTGITASIDRKARIDNMSTAINEWMENQDTKLGKDSSPEEKFDMLASFITYVQDDKNWTEQDIRELYTGVLDKMKRTNKDTNTSLFETLLKSYSDKNDAELRTVINSLRANPKNKELLDVLEGKGNP